MDAAGSDTENRKAGNARRMGWLKGGCLLLLLLGVGALLVARELFHYEFSVASVMTLPVEIAGGKAVVYRYGFGDVSCDYYVSLDDAPEVLYHMGVWEVESPYHGSFSISADGKLVVTESDFAQYRHEPSKPDPGGSPRPTLYTHALNLETTEYIAPNRDFTNEDEATHRARHEVIAEMLEAHGGIGSSFTLSREELQTRPLGYLEWRRWERMLSTARSRG